MSRNEQCFGVGGLHIRENARSCYFHVTCRYGKKLCTFNKTKIYLLLSKVSPTSSSRKLVFYRSFTNEHTTSNHLDLTKKTAERGALVKLRTASPQTNDRTKSKYSTMGNTFLQTKSDSIPNQILSSYQSTI